MNKKHHLQTKLIIMNNWLRMSKVSLARINTWLPWLGNWTKITANPPGSYPINNKQTTNIIFILTKKPFYYATNIREQIQMIYGKSCVDFTTSWMLAEKYVKEMEIEETYSRFNIILMSMILQPILIRVVLSNIRQRLRKLILNLKKWQRHYT